LIPKTKPLKKYLLFIYTCLLALTIFIVQYLEPNWIYRYVWIIMIFFLLLTLASIWTTKYAALKLGKQFIQVYFIVMTIRLLISLAFAIIFIIKDRDNILIFSINFLVLYLLFLGFEIYSILTNLRTHFKKGIGNDQKFH